MTAAFTQAYERHSQRVLRLCLRFGGGSMQWAEDVTHVHLYKQGVGKGVWFRLNDGRVFDCIGRPSQLQDHGYEPSAN